MKHIAMMSMISYTPMTEFYNMGLYDMHEMMMGIKDAKKELNQAQERARERAKAEATK